MEVDPNQSKPEKGKPAYSIDLVGRVERLTDSKGHIRYVKYVQTPQGRVLRSIARKPDWVAYETSHNPSFQVPARRSKFEKGSEEARAYMASLRAMRKPSKGKPFEGFSSVLP